MADRQDDRHRRVDDMGDLRFRRRPTLGVEQARAQQRRLAEVCERGGGQDGLSASPDEIARVQTAYLIAEGIRIPLSGDLRRALSTRVVLTIAAAGFTIASVLCAMSSSINEIILWRAAQGFIGGSRSPAFSPPPSPFPPFGLLGMAGFLGSLESVLAEGTRLDRFERHAVVFFRLVMAIGAVSFFWRALTRDDCWSISMPSPTATSPSAR